MELEQEPISTTVRTKELFDDQLHDALENAITIAMVDFSNDPSRPSYDVVKYLPNQGCRIAPGSPKFQQILDEQT